MSTVAAGRINFVKPLNIKEYTELSIFITKAAISSEIGVNLQYNISPRINKRFVRNDMSGSELTEMAYELTENPWCSQSDALFYGAVYNDDYTCDGIDKMHSKVIRIQNFFESVFKSDLVREITFELWEELPPKEADELSINPKDFFDVLDKAYKSTRATDSSLIPSIRLKMLNYRIKVSKR